MFCRTTSLVLVLLIPFGVGCQVEQRPPARAASPVPSGFTIPADSLIPSGVEGISIRRGRALVLNTRDSLPDHVGNKLRCTSCHLDGGVRRDAMPLIGVYARFPQYRTRSNIVERMEDRVNDCFLRSMNGRPLDVEGADMRDMVAWFGWISRGVPVGGVVPGVGMPQVEPLEPDPASGARLYGESCARCHGAAGEGTVIAPPVWGDSSYNIGAGMARLRTLAAFLRTNMPYDLPGSLTDQQAYDLAAYVNGQPRPDLAGKERDWPAGNPPPDVAYPTKASPARQAPR
ncbi:MAG: c-type cytochrome [Gemmatimonadota bacterium]|nr:c-type cytochrome [Gemmatimonadota bacterium]